SPLDFPVAQATPGVDRLTIEAICEILEHYGHAGYVLKTEYQHQYIRLLTRGIDLTDPIYIERINSVVRLTVDSEISTRRKVPIFKSWWPRTYFTLVADADIDLILKVICRLPYESLDDNKIMISINNKPLEEIQGTHKWGKYQMLIPAHKLLQGF